MAAGILITNYDVAQIFLGSNYYETVSYSNSTGSPVTITIGRTIGRILATDKVLPSVAAATDGSELPIGVSAQTYVIADGVTQDIQIVTGGQVNENLVVLAAGNTFSTAVRTVSTGGGTIRDLIRRNTTIELVPTTDLSNLDNQ